MENPKSSHLQLRQNNGLKIKIIANGFDQNFLVSNVRAAFEFHISREARDYHQFDDSLYSLSGNVIFANFHAARVFAQKMNKKRDLINIPERAVMAGQINALGLIDEILHYVVRLYRQQVNPQCMQQALEWLHVNVGKEKVDQTLLQFSDQFPPVAVYRQEIMLDDYLEGETEGISNRLIALEEMLLLWLANVNLACKPFSELFDDAALEKHSAYTQIIESLIQFFETQATFGPQNKTLIEMLRSPSVHFPHSLAGQLEYIRKHWGYLIGSYLYQLLKSLDLIEEEGKAFFAGPGPARVYDFRGLEVEEERFSPDQDWMPRLVLIAKNTYVWLDQLSKQYQKDIHRLDQVPDEELDKIADWGFTGLWLIGLWQRSPASRRIKQMAGNPEAVSSAYSLYDYIIADDIGGEEAYQDLKSRAWQRGIHLAADMVPNHVGIYSKWLIEHPDWFISLDYIPYPAYSYNGPDLSENQRVGIYLEDHYYNRTDAAVTFKRVDRWTGDEKFIYHGNDGTSMPWNDTAQLNFLNPQAREAVIQTILHVARKFPIIRFDAAMTLSKKHYQRLWFPEPGTGGAIPTRSEHGLTKNQFDQAMPTEFWREVVDRVADEVPNTLLLAEAFWLMEGYFVRTLGMHRVYNSAFMNMLRDEKNRDYRLVIKNTLEFDPQILKRYVNFMNNPDEDTAVAQFGKDDKYFGVCILMVTMPGLPMFGHGQVEGFHEKYGMEYRKAYWDEKPDTYLVERHEREIFPLLHRRHLFAEVKDFLLYDFFNADGSVNEDVFAYSNRQGEERSLVIFHNKWAEARGWIKTSVAYLNKKDEQLHQKSLGVGLSLQNDPNHFVIFRDHISGLEYIRNSNHLYEKGLYIELGAYKYHVFLDFREVVDNQWHQYAHLESYLDGRGVPDIQEAMKEIFLKPIHHPYRDLINANMLLWLLDNRTDEDTKDREPPREELLSEVQGKFNRLMKEVKHFTGGDGNVATLAQEVRRKLNTILDLPVIEQSPVIPPAFSPQQYIINSFILPQTTREGVEIDETQDWVILFGWLFSHNLGKIITEGDFTERSRSWIDEWLLGKIILQVSRDLGLSEGEASYALTTIKILISHQGWFQEHNHEESSTYAIMQNWLSDAEVQRYLGFNRYQGLLWYNQDAYQQFLRWMMTIAVIETIADQHMVEEKQADSISALIQIFDKLGKAEEASEYQVEKLLDALKN